MRSSDFLCIVLLMTSFVFNLEKPRTGSPYDESILNTQLMQKSPPPLSSEIDAPSSPKLLINSVSYITVIGTLLPAKLSAPPKVFLIVSPWKFRAQTRELSLLVERSNLLPSKIAPGFFETK